MSRLMVRSARIDYRSASWHFHRACGFAFWYSVAGYVSYRQIAGAMHHTWPTRYAAVIVGCLVMLLHPPVQGGHWLTYRRFPWWLFPLNIPLYLVNVMPQSRAVNYTEMRLRHAFGFHSELPGSLIGMATVGLLPLWLGVAIVKVAGL